MAVKPIALVAGIGMHTRLTMEHAQKVKNMRAIEGGAVRIGR
jgi:hypothetical protein